MRVCDTEKKDLSKVVECHRKAFPGTLSSAMGKAYVFKMLEWYLSTDKTFLFHIEENGMCVGYCGGMMNMFGSASGMAQFSFRAGVKAFLLRPWLIFHPEIVKKLPFIKRSILKRFGLIKIKQSSSSRHSASKETSMGLVVIGVAPAYQGNGYGTLLLQEFERRALLYNIKKLRLSVKADNTQAIRAYERNGWYKGELKGESLSMMKIVQ